MTRNEKAIFLTENIKGVGEKRAFKIVEAFGDIECADYTSQPDFYKRMKSAGLSEKTADGIFKELEKCYLSSDALKELLPFVPYSAAAQISKEPMLLKSFSEDAYKYIHEYGLSFGRVDAFMHYKVGDRADLMVSRVRFLVEKSLERAEDSSNTWLTLSQLARMMDKYQEAQFGSSDVVFNIATVLYYVGTDPAFRIEKRGDPDEWRIYKRSTYEMEEEAGMHVRRLSAQVSVPELRDLTVVDDEFKYDNTQKSIISSVRKSGLKIITGPPGCGKTAVIRGIISSFKRHMPDEAILLAAPTGRAAKRMEEVTGMPSQTLHKLLKIRPDEQVEAGTVLDAKLIICDEASMINLELLTMFLSAVKQGTILYLVGDKDQLPAVGAGDVLHNIIDSGIVPVYAMTKVYRQDGLILENARKINNGKSNLKQDEKTFLIKEVNAEDMLKEASDHFRALYNPEFPFDTQILAPGYEGVGINALNAEARKLNPNYTADKKNFTEGDKVLMLHNDTKEHLYQNGSLGIFREYKNGEMIIDFEEKDGLRCEHIPALASKDAMLGYAMSVHKSQGSEYDNVIICLTRHPAPLLRRQVLYTAVTRAKRRVIILAEPGTFEKAVADDRKARVQTGLMEKLVLLGDGGEKNAR